MPAPKPGTFDFLGFTHVCARSRRGRFTMHVRTIRKRLRRSLKAVAQWCQEHRHDPVDKPQRSSTPNSRATTSIRASDEFRGLRKFYRGSGITGVHGSIAVLVGRR